MPPSLTTFTDEALLALDALTGRAANLVNPSIRLGVTGLSRAGKTVFISSLVHNLLNGGRMPLFEAGRSGRVSKIRLEPQPDDAVPRFQYEDHIRDLVADRLWPDSTRAISQLRLTLDYESASGWGRLFSPGKLSIDIVDYPGEWLLDLPLLGQDFRTFSENTVALARSGIRAELARDWLALAATVDPAAEAQEATARTLAEAVTAYLKACKSDERSLSTLPPGRFLMPGDLEGSPALTFAPLPNLPEGRPDRGSLHAMMERRYEAYKDVVVRPFFRDHFARLDRQIVLVDALQALNAGPGAVADLADALADILACFRPGKASWLASILTRRIDRIVFAATKADHLHRSSHDRLEKILRRLVAAAMERATFAGAAVDVVALAAVRATREATIEHEGETLPAILGRPLPGETLAGEALDPEAEFALFPGDLPDDPDSLFETLEARREAARTTSREGPESESGSTAYPRAADSPGELRAPDVEFVRFRPPRLERTAEGFTLSLPHIRLDRTLEFLLGDRLT